MAIRAALFLAGTKKDVGSSPIARILTLHGRWSYEIYLFHMPILKLLYANNIYTFPVVRYGMGATFVLTLFTIFVISGAIAIWLLDPISRRIRRPSGPPLDLQPLSTRAPLEFEGFTELSIIPLQDAKQQCDIWRNIIDHLASDECSPSRRLPPMQAAAQRV